jgi:hypothetical protein
MFTSRVIWLPQSLGLNLGSVQGASQLAVALPPKSLEHVAGKNAGASKLRSLLHQVENRAFSLVADDRQGAHIDHQFASLEPSPRLCPGRAKLIDPGTAQLSFDHQLALGRSLDDGYLEHPGSRNQSGKRNPVAKAASPQRTETAGGSQVVAAGCQRMSKPELTLVETGHKRPDLGVNAEHTSHAHKSS